MTDARPYAHAARVYAVTAKDQIAARLEDDEDPMGADQRTTYALLNLMADSVLAVINAVEALDARQLAPVVPIARGPLDYQPAPEITLATVDTPEARAWREDGGR